MSVTFRSDGIAVEGNAPLEFLDTLLRGIGQVMFQNNTYTGALFLAGLFYSSTIAGLAALLGTAASTATAILFGADRALVRAGIFGFNGALTAIAVVSFLEPDLLAWCYLVVASAFSAVVTAALASFLRKWKIPPLTGPFVLTAWCFLLPHARFGRIHPASLPAAELPVPASVGGLVELMTLVEGLYKGVAQVFVQDKTVTGILFLVGLFVSSRIAAVAALLGSLVGLVVAWGLGAAEPDIRLGLFWFNSALTAIALAGTFLVVDRRSITYALLASAVAAVVFAALSAALQPMGMPALTAPFVLVVWAFLLAMPLFPQLRGVVAGDEGRAS